LQECPNGSWIFVLQGDKFIPEPLLVMDMDDLAYYLLTEPRKGKEKPVA